MTCSESAIYRVDLEGGRTLNNPRNIMMPTDGLTGKLTGTTMKLDELKKKANHEMIDPK